MPQQIACAAAYSIYVAFARARYEDALSKGGEHSIEKHISYGVAVDCSLVTQRDHLTGDT